MPDDRFACNGDCHGKRPYVGLVNEGEHAVYRGMTVLQRLRGRDVRAWVMFAGVAALVFLLANRLLITGRAVGAGGCVVTVNRAEARSPTYILDEATTGLHPPQVEKLVVEHEMRIVIRDQVGDRPSDGESPPSLKSDIGSMVMRPYRTMRCRCGPVTRPVAPTLPIT